MRAFKPSQASKLRAPKPSLACLLPVGLKAIYWRPAESKHSHAGLLASKPSHIGLLALKPSQGRLAGLKAISVRPVGLKAISYRPAGLKAISCRPKSLIVVSYRPADLKALSCRPTCGPHCHLRVASGPQSHFLPVRMASKPFQNHLCPPSQGGMRTSKPFQALTQGNSAHFYPLYSANTAWPREYCMSQGCRSQYFE